MLARQHALMASIHPSFASSSTMISMMSKGRAGKLEEIAMQDEWLLLL